ncbi:methionine--tRNA ligase [Candidatus Amesbacteria bacterium RIFCSPLOWO2_01_FULL_49_25]|uniref:Methionine--tRNA ligase n=1 Tax=Candidatus Amesbacteria bacterium RIFCSPHIGHO2_01_FULL_48_32b TaxID=1797253 RepID=A0A1F4YGI4_9BACT|nr:MAG: methionine--tRNA ligase [Candidatus Amesbacteria bacterium RIFCSPHIGHO2_01_FULL_48_32b]OGD07427.1 MAG: methionine--tRNA ligase [Candidatus Amesbacteria bacterium RIFCSPLOWO2_01_FULL_49_25]
MNTKKYYITTTIPYVNSEPHVGFALEIVQADVLARYHRLLGEEVFHNFGADEHGLKIYRKALELGKGPQEYCDEYAAKFDALKQTLNLDYDNFIRTTDPKHIAAAQEFWRRCLASGDVYKKNYKIKYCVGCELEKTGSELKDGKCEFHPNLDLEIYEEENYFFRFSKYQKPLLEFYEKNLDFVIPEGKYNEIKEFVKRGLEDFSISRLKKKMPWGVDIPDDLDQVMYVWFDALVNYISALGWPEDDKKFKEFWPGIQTAGKDNLRQQTAIWQAMLLSAGLPNTKQVFIHGFITVNGQKISKSAGTAIAPNEITDKYGTDALRYYVLAKIHPWEDSDFTWQKFNETYNADLANGLGNLVARVAKLAEKVAQFDPSTSSGQVAEQNKFLDEFRFDEALRLIWERISELDKQIEKDQPWKLEQDKLESVLKNYVDTIRKIVTGLQPFLPETAEKILKQFAGPKIKAEAPLFPRIR